MHALDISRAFLIYLGVLLEVIIEVVCIISNRMKLVARVFKSREVYMGAIGRFDERSGGPIEKAAQKQFAKYRKGATDKYYTHNFTHYYDKALKHLYKEHRSANNPMKILEIGVKKGASLSILKEVFPQAEVYGIDINDVSQELFLKGRDDIKLFVGDQSDTEFLKKEIIPHGPFDVIIDDGIHQPKPIHISLETLWGSLAPLGVYVIEDFWHSVHHSSDKPLMMDKLRDMIGGIYSTGDVLSVECYLNIVFIRKT